LSKVVLESSVETTLNTDANNAEDNKWKLQGLISHAPASPHPANVRDLQFFSINGRPVDLPSVSRVLGDVWRLFDPSASSGRRRPACILAITLPNNMYDVNLSPDKREVMFTEEAAMSDLIREGLMALWSSQSEGKFAANEVESRSNNSKSGRGGTGSEVRNGNEIQVMDLLAESGEANSGLKGNDREGTSAKAKGDSENDNITPKLRRRNTSSVPSKDDGPLVTPLDSENSPTDQIHDASGPSPEAENDNFDGKNNDGNGVSSTSKKEMLQPEQTEAATQENNAIPQQEEVVAPTQHGRERQQDQRGWDQMQLPERARQQDRRGWEQMQINFQQIEKKQLQQDAMLSSVDDGEDRGPSNTRHEEMTKQCSSKKPSNTNSDQTAAAAKKSSATKASLTESSATRRQSKRQKHQKQDVASFLDSFSFGSTKPAASSKDSDNESDSVSEEPETIEKSDNSRRSSRKESDSTLLNKRNVRMVVGRTIMSESEKRPRTSLRGTRNKETNPTSSKPSLQEDDNCNDAELETINDDSASPPIEAVWNSFSGTKDVIAQSQNARLMMQKNRKRLRSSVKRKRNGDGDATTENSGDESTVNFGKEDFLHMSIIGQFNLGFILARCRNHNLWILDQHSCDEKYNFERLCKETVIHEQKLIAPLPLELSPSEESCVLENMDIFERNGFRLSYDSEKEHRHRLSLTAIPHSGSGGDGKKAVQFGKEDVGALCAMLGAAGTSSSEGYTAGFGAGLPEGGRIAGVNAVRRYAGLSGGSSQGGAKSDGIVGSSIVRLPKAVAMFASRACRGSIMIGTALSHKEQMNILSKLDKTDIPWNCAHGRPTMSHIRSLTKCLIDDDDTILAHVAGPSLSVISEE